MTYKKNLYYDKIRRTKRKIAILENIAIGLIAIGFLVAFWLLLSLADNNSPREAWCIKQKNIVENYPAEWTDTLQDICGDIEDIN